jgi:hypothetical protein
LKTEFVTLAGLAKSLSPKNLRETLSSLRKWQIVTAVEEYNRARADGGLVDPIVFVDNQPNKKIVNVKLGGRILFQERTLEGRTLNVAPYVWNLLYKLSPVLSSEYLNSFVMFYNGQRMAPGDPNAVLKDSADSIIFVNRMPYAKRLEGVRGFSEGQRSKRAEGQTRRLRPTTITQSSKKWVSSQAPNGVFYVAGRKTAKTFRGRVSVAFTYLAISQFYGMTYANGKTVNSDVYSEQRKKRMPAVFPALILTLDTTRGLAPEPDRERGRVAPVLRGAVQ